MRQASEASNAPPQRHFFGSKYELIEQIATGGMAEVYLAMVKQGAATGRRVAIKRVLPRYSDRRPFVMMFLQEARIGAQLSHPNIVDIYDLGCIDGDYFIAMEYVEGHTLREVLHRIRQARLKPSLPVMAKLLSEVAQGLWYAHRAANKRGVPLRIVHRDISPSNILISLRGEVKITDFGLAKATGALHKTSARSVKGKYAYMAPEQAMSKEVDHRADLFSLGVVLHEATTLKRIFADKNRARTISAVLKRAITPPSTVVQGYPAALERIVMRCLQRKRTDRYQDARAVHQDLEQYLAKIGPPVRTDEIAAELRRIFAGTGERTLPSLDLKLEETTHSALGAHLRRGKQPPRKVLGLVPKEVALVLLVLVLLTGLTWALAFWAVNG
jgi:serine/threonine protein kinase